MPQPRPRLRSFDEASTWELLRRLALYLGRAMRLRCPECGVSRVFMPVSRTRSWDDWVTPLDGCPRCGYAYQREGGYFLIATWGVHYFTVTGLCLLAALLVDHFVPMSFTLLALSVTAMTLVFGAWFARYAKSLYLAIDHFFDPHVREGGDKGPAPSPPVAPVGSGGRSTGRF